MTLIPDWWNVFKGAYSSWGLWVLIILNAVVAGITTYIENADLTILQLGILNIIIAAITNIARLIKQPELSGDV